MAPIAAVTTGPGAGAIATIQLFGDSAEAVLREIFRQAGGKPSQFTLGRIFLGDIVDGMQTIDQVTIGCEGTGLFAIHCHGNPLIVGRIMGLLGRRGAQPVFAEQLLAEVLSRGASGDSISVEAKLALATVKTIEGARIIANQTKRGLAAKVRQWRDNLDSLPVEQIVAEAKQILRDSDTARLILSGCMIALIGPPNTGKSTLLNTLAGREKAIVTDVRGTTRDWVTAEVHISPLIVTIIDTAGLDPVLAAAGDIDDAAQRKSIEVLSDADVILLVLDASQPADQFSQAVAVQLVGCKTITVLNKADLPQKLDSNFLPAHLRNAVRLSAKQETGIEDLIQAIHNACSVTDFPLNTPVTFTDRQRILVERLAASGSHDEVRARIVELLFGPVAKH